MKLRGHQKIKHWPPTWGGSYGPGDQFLLGEEEEAVVKNIRLVGPDRIGPARLYLDVEYQRKTQSGLISSDDPTFMARLYEKVREEFSAQRAQSVRAIGNLEIDF